MPCRGRCRPDPGAIKLHVELPRLPRVDDGRGLNDIPAMADFVGKFLTVDNGRAYLVQVLPPMLR